MNKAVPIDKLLKVLLLLFLFITGLYFAKYFFIPIVIASLLSFLFLPVSKRLERMGAGKIISIVICLLIIITIILTLIFLLYSQLMDFKENLPMLESKAKEKTNTILRFIESAVNISYEKQRKWILEIKETLGETKWIKNIFLTTTNLLLNLGLIITYIFCFLYYRNKFSAFLISLSPKEATAKTEEIMLTIRKLSGSYFSGVLTVMLILGTMHSIGLLLLGIEHAIFLGYLAGMFILVPIVGTMAGSTIPFLIALITKESIWYAIGVAAIFSFNLFIESQILTPLIVGSHIRINPMAVILSIVIGGFIWGLPGMILFIPLLGILKIISDNVESLYPLKILLSDDNEKKPSRIYQNIKKKFRK